MQNLHFIDAHHHLWDLQACHYPWLMAKGVKRFFGDPAPIQRNYLAQDFLGESPRYVPARSVHIQVGVAAEDEVKETAWVQSQDTRPDAIVAATDLANEDLQASLAQHLQHQKLRGIRQILGRHEIEDQKHGSNALLDNPAFARGLHTLAKNQLSFDLQMIPPQMPQVVALLREIPELKVALCHCGSPWDQTPQGLQRWRKGLAELAELPNVYCKVSGLGMFNPGWTPSELEPIILSVIDIFGPQRIMFGSNFPVDKLYNSYDALWQAYELITQDFSEQERRDMFVNTATRFYRLKD